MLSTLSPNTGPVADDVVKDVTLATFVADVIEASKTSLVIVDFWATWCGPCKQLTPLLEKIARSSQGKVRLAKIDVDRNQPIAQQMGVQSVPSVFAFFQGRPVDGFAGALPEGQLKTWLDGLMGKIGVIPGDEKAELESALRQADEYRGAKDYVTAHAIYLDIIDRDPTSAVAYAGLASCALDQGDMPGAQDILDSLTPEMAKNKAFDSLRAALELARQTATHGNVPELQAKITQNENDHQVRFNLALALYGEGRREEAVDQLLEIVRRDRGWNEDGARKQLLTFFEAMGVMDPVTIDARKRLSSLLFA